MFTTLLSKKCLLRLYGMFLAITNILLHNFAKSSIFYLLFEALYLCEGCATYYAHAVLFKKTGNLALTN